jgi:hypothetical protein
LATCSNGFPLNEWEQNPVGGKLNINQNIKEMFWAIHSFGVATNALQEEAIEKLQKLRHKSKSSTLNVESSGPAKECGNKAPENDSLLNHHHCKATACAAHNGDNGMPTPLEKAGIPLAASTIGGIAGSPLQSDSLCSVLPIMEITECPRP